MFKKLKKESMKLGMKIKYAVSVSLTGVMVAGANGRKYSETTAGRILR
jgi:hypothetical protein